MNREIKLTYEPLHIPPEGYFGGERWPGDPYAGVLMDHLPPTREQLVDLYRKNPGLEEYHRQRAEERSKCIPLSNEEVRAWLAAQLS